MRCRSGQAFEFRLGQDVKSGQSAITRGLDRLDALCRGRRRPVKGLDRLSGDWRAIKRAPIALDRLPPPARLHPSDQGPRQGRAPLRLLHPLKIQKKKARCRRCRKSPQHDPPNEPKAPKAGTGALAAVLNSSIADEAFRCISGSAAVFDALCIGAIEGSGTFFGPKHVYRRTDKQAKRTGRWTGMGKLRMVCPGAEWACGVVRNAQRVALRCRPVRTQ